MNRVLDWIEDETMLSEVIGGKTKPGYMILDDPDCVTTADGPDPVGLIVDDGAPI